MAQITEKQLAEYNRLRLECRDLLLEVVDGHIDLQTPKEIAHPNASCLIGSVIEKLGEIDMVLEHGK